MKNLEMKVKLTLTEDMLGTASADPEIYRNYLAAKAVAEGKTIEDELESLKAADPETTFEKALTVFHRDPETNSPIIYDYLVKGFFKNACSVLKNVPGSKSSKVKAFKKYIDGLVFVKERRIQINLSDEITICERPLRASTAQGERIALAASESIPAGSTMEITILCLNEEMFDIIPEWLDYGALNGLGQWHNSGKGRFTWEYIE